MNASLTPAVWSRGGLQPQVGCTTPASTPRRMPLRSPPELWGIWSLWRRQQARGLRRVENAGNRAPASPANTSLGGPKWGGISGTMLFIFLFLNKSEVSGGTNEVIRKDMSGIKPPAGRPRRALGTRTLEKLRGFVYLRLCDTGLGPGCWTNMSPGPPQPVPLGGTRELGHKQYFENDPISVPCSRVAGCFPLEGNLIHFSPRPRKCSSQKQRAQWGKCPHGAQSQPLPCHQLALPPDGPSTCQRVYALPRQRGWPLCLDSRVPVTGRGAEVMRPLGRAGACIPLDPDRP